MPVFSTIFKYYAAVYAAFNNLVVVLALEGQCKDSSDLSLRCRQLMGKKGQESLSGMIGRLCGHSNLLQITTLDKMLFMHYSQC